MKNGIKGGSTSALPGIQRYGIRKENIRLREA